MCEHTRRPKLFCILQNCPKVECCACVTCLKNIHGHGSEHYLDQNEITYMLTRFDPPATFKEERKGTVVKMYKFLARFKSELSGKLEEMISNLMSKVKYPYLYQAELLQSYRHLRDKNYQRLNPRKFRLFCKTARNLSGNQFIDKEKEFYNQYLLEVQDSLRGFGQKIRSVQNIFGFDLGSDLMKMHEQFMAEADAFKKVHKLGKSPDKKDYSIMKQKNPLNNSVRLEKQTMDFLTPTKPTISLDISIENLSYQSSGDKTRKQSESWKTDFKDSNRLSFDFDKPKRVNTSQQQKKDVLKTINESDSKTIRSSEQNKMANEESPFKMNVHDLYNYEDQLSNSYKIKISGLDKEKESQNRPKSHFQNLKNDFLTSSIQLETKEDQARRMSYHEQILNMSIKDREEHVKARITELLKQSNADSRREKSLIQEKNVLSLKEPVKLRKYSTDITSKKELDLTLAAKKSASKSDLKSLLSERSKDNFHLTSSPWLQKKIEKESTPFQPKKQLKSPTKHPEISIMQNKSNSLMNQNNKKSPRKVSNNVSLGKQFVHYESQKSHQSITLQFRNATKEIPLAEPHSKESPPPRKLLKKKSFQIVQDQQLEASAVLIAKMQEMKNPLKVMEFLEKFIEKQENCLSAAEHLSFIYFQQGRLKECLTLTTRYLQKLDHLKVSEAQKVGFAINKSAALNQLGRYSQVVATLKKFEGVENQKVHKNIGDALFNLGTTDRAIYHYEKATKLDQKYDEAYYNLAVILYLQESYYNAKMNIDKAIRWQPKNPDYIELLEAIKERMTSCPQ